MNTFSFRPIRRRLISLIVAAVLAVTAAYAPVAVDGTTDANLVSAAHACPHTGSGC